jgi:hypothetical protein
MIPALAMEALDLLGLTVTAAVPVAANAPDFAAVMALVGDGAAVAANAPGLVVPVASVEELVSSPVVVSPVAETKVNRGQPERRECKAQAVGTDAAIDAPREPKVPEQPDNADVCQKDSGLPQSVERPVLTVPDVPVLLVASEPVQAEATRPKPKPARADVAAPASIDLPGPVIAAPIVVERISLVAVRKTEGDDPVTVTIADGPRPSTPLPIERSTITLPDRVPTFPAYVVDAARDILSIIKDNDVRFNVRPETLGTVAVTIERGDAGPSLRLGVETAAAVQAVRQAEPMLNDLRGALPFVQVTVDLNSPDARGRAARAPATARRGHTAISGVMIEQAPTRGGRYA